MFKIGDFSKLSRVPVKTLRYYDEIGLLKPKGISRFTRYRYYSADQLPVLYRILALKELGFSLEQIGRLLEGRLTPEQLAGMLEARRGEISQQIESSQAQLSQVEARLRQIEQEGRLPHYEVIQKEIKPQWVAAAGGLAPGEEGYSLVLDRLFAQVSAYVDGAGCNPAGPAIALYYDASGPDEGMRVEAALPLPRRLVERPGVRVYELPGLARAASTVHQGGFESIGNAYAAVLSWSQGAGCRVGAPTREVYLRYVRGAEQDKCVTEIQFPLLSKERKDREAMEPKIVNVERFMVAGLRYAGKNEHGEIPEMWGEFNKRWNEVRHLVELPTAAYGLCYMLESGEMEYVAGRPVTTVEDPAPGMVVKEVEPESFAVFEAKGVSDIMATYGRIMEWLPSSGYQRGRGPDYEYYPPDFDPEHANESKLYIYFPVTKA